VTVPGSDTATNGLGDPRYFTSIRGASGPRMQNLTNKENGKDKEENYGVVEKESA